MASGDLDSPIAVSRDDEIRELARRFDEMRVKLMASMEESARWAEEIERRVRERTREVDERNRELNALNRIRRQLLAKTISAQEEERIDVQRIQMGPVAQGEEMGALRTRLLTALAVAGLAVAGADRDRPCRSAREMVTNATGRGRAAGDAILKDVAEVTR